MDDEKWINDKAYREIFMKEHIRLIEKSKADKEAEQKPKPVLRVIKGGLCN